MTAILLISLLIFLASALIISRWQKKQSFNESRVRFIEGRALFEAEPVEGEGESDAKAALLARAASGEVATLEEARDTPLYTEVLDRLVEWARGDDTSERLKNITSFILSDGQLRTNQQLAAIVSEQWLGSPKAQTLSQMLRIAALSDDAAGLERSIEGALRSWRQGQIEPMTSTELVNLIDAEYWVLSDAARRSGRGNVLKQTLARVHRDLAMQRESTGHSV